MMMMMMMDKDMDVYYIYDTLIHYIIHRGTCTLSIDSSFFSKKNRFSFFSRATSPGRKPSSSKATRFTAYGGFLKWYPFLAGWFVVENPSKNE